MLPIAQTQNSDQIRNDPIAEWNLLPDELVLEIFNQLSTLERAKASSTCHKFNNLGQDHALLTSEVKVCQEMVRTFVEKNKTSPLSKNLSEMNLDWNHPWIALQNVSKVYRFDKMTIAQLAALTVPLEKSNDLSLVGNMQHRYVQEVIKQVKDKEGVYRFEHGCSFTNDSFRIFLHAISENPKIEKLVIQCDLSSDQMAILSHMIKTNALKVPGLLIKSEMKYSIAALRNLFEGVANNQTLKAFEFHHELRNEELVFLNRALEKNETLEKIGLNGSMISVPGLQAFLGVLAHKPNVKSLVVYSNLEDAFLLELFQNLPQTSIENIELEIFRMRMNEANGIGISEAIKNNPKVKRILFSKYELSDAVADHMNEVFMTHPNLKLQDHPKLKPFC